MWVLETSFGTLYQKSADTLKFRFTQVSYISQQKKLNTISHVRQTEGLTICLWAYVSIKCKMNIFRGKCYHFFHFQSCYIRWKFSITINSFQYQIKSVLKNMQFLALKILYRVYEQLKYQLHIILEYTFNLVLKGIC